MSADVWTIVLAAGEGRGLASVTGGVPKQYWRPEGSRATLLGGTLARLSPVSSPERTITVVDRAHCEYVATFPDRCPLGEVMYQPTDRGTAAGVLLPLVEIVQSSPDAIVVITPSDHGVEDARGFQYGLKQAIHHVRNRTSSVVMFGVEPADITEGFGWITPFAPGDLAHNTFQRVLGFVEKPAFDQACDLFALGAVWNTMVVVARASALLERYRRFLPFHTDVMSHAARLGGTAREEFLTDWYPELPPSDFSRDLFTSADDLSVYTWPPEIGWTDLGTPDRMEQWVALQRPLWQGIDTLAPSIRTFPSAT